ncbi:MAG TPA: Hpt domain-containing protein, partial [Parvibaculum sp.]
MSASDLSQLSMQDLFRIEAENQVQALTAGLLILERSPTAPEQLEACMRAAHSVKGAARIVDVSAGVTLAHAMEDCFVAAQHGHIKLSRARIDLLLEGVDLLTDITNSLGSEEAARAEEQSRKVDGYVRRLSAALAEVEEDAMSGSADAPAPNERTSSDRPSSDRTAPERRPIGADTSKTGTDEPPVKASPSVAPLSAPSAVEPDPSGEAPGRAIRVTVENLNGLLGLAGESMVDSRWL